MNYMHLNWKGNSILISNFKKYLNNLDWRLEITAELNDYPDNSSTDFEDLSQVPSDSLKIIRKKNLNRIIIAEININSIRNKFEMLLSFIEDNIDILVIIETKLDKSFPTNQFLLPGFSEPFRYDRNQFGGGILVFVRADIPCYNLNIKRLSIEALFIEINLRKKMASLLYI